MKWKGLLVGENWNPEYSLFLVPSLELWPLVFPSNQVQMPKVARKAAAAATEARQLNQLPLGLSICPFLLTWPPPPPLSLLFALIPFSVIGVTWPLRQTLAGRWKRLIRIEWIAVITNKWVAHVRKQSLRSGRVVISQECSLGEESTRVEFGEGGGAYRTSLPAPLRFFTNSAMGYCAFAAQRP